MVSGIPVNLKNCHAYTKTCVIVIVPQYSCMALLCINCSYDDAFRFVQVPISFSFLLFTSFEFSSYTIPVDVSHLLI